MKQETENLVGRLRRRVNSWLWSGCVAAVLVGCVGSAGETRGGESHFLERCGDGCAAGLECLDGVCTRSCKTDSACRDLDEDAVCRESSPEVYACSLDTDPTTAADARAETTVEPLDAASEPSTEATEEGSSAESDVPDADVPPATASTSDAQDSGAEATAEPASSTVPSGSAPDAAAPAADAGVADAGAADAGNDPTPTQCTTGLDSSPLAGTVSAYTTFDSESSACLEINEQGQLCVSGVAAQNSDAGAGLWGAGLNLVVAANEAGFDAAALGVTQFRLELSDVVGGPLHIDLSMVDAPGIQSGNNFQGNPFRLFPDGPAAESPTFETGTHVLPFDDYALPEWTTLDTDDDGEGNPEVPLDASRLFAVVLLVDSMSGPFSYCVPSLQWLDADGETVFGEP